MLLLKIFLGIFFVFFICEYAIYYIVLRQCNWPSIDSITAEPNITVQPYYKPIKTMFIADLHLLGSRNGHWFDKLRREWQMHRAFQASVQLLKPEIIFVLGDVFDEGLWCSKDEFQYYVKRFHNLFYVPRGTKVYVIAGNHDMGFHYGISPYLMERFTTAFESSAVKLVSIYGNHFVLINSMAFEGDGCFLCRPAELQINNIENRLKCTKGKRKCGKNMHLGTYSRPILLQHFPLYRESDKLRCDEEGDDMAPEAEQTMIMRERWDCLSKEATDTLLQTLDPRLAIGGHTHHSCHRIHTGHTGLKTEEISISSFSWRNKDNPSFILANITTNNYAISKCHMPKESTVIAIYHYSSLILVFYAIFSYRRMFRKYFWTSRYKFFKRH